MDRRRRTPPVLCRCLVVLLVLGAALTAFSAPAPATSTDSYVGQWDHRNSQGFRSVLRLDADGSWTSAGNVIGKWSVDGKLLTIRFIEHPEWLDRFAVPVQDGALHGRDAAGGIVTLARRVLATTTPLAGVWDFFNPEDGKRVKVTLSDDGTWTEGDQPTGFWQVVGDQLVLNFKGLHDWVDTYDLPPKGDVLYGQNRGGGHLTLARNGARPGENPARPLPEALAGAWNFSNAYDGNRTTRYLSKDGKFSIGGKPSGIWRTVSDQLVLTYEIGGYTDRYNLPPDSGFLRGVNNLGHKLTLARANASLPKDLPEPVNLPASTTTAARTTPAAEPSGKAGTASRPEFFGKRVVGMADPVAPSVAPTASVAATTTPTPATTLTPVGSWRWHSNIMYTLTENGAVKAGANVAGQWKWTNKEQGEIQVHWNLIPVRPPEDYTLSPQGNHLTWRNAPQGDVKTEDRVN